ncbi:MAG: septum site-determining protein MinC [Paracoccaceae bacterium]
MRTTSPQGGAVAVSAAPAPFQVRGRFLTAVVLRLQGAPGEGFFEALDAQLAQSSRFFAGAPLALDLAEAGGLETPEDVAWLLGGLRERRLAVIGVQNPSEAQSAAALAAGLSTLPPGREAPLERPRAETPEPEAPPPDAASATPALIVTEPVRSGQRLHAEGDLVVVASVGSGSELAAKGSIHVYGPLRGRALAGIDGDRSARIFCQSLEAELIAIAGLYKTSDALDRGVLKKRVQAYLDADALVIEPLR